MGVLLKDGLLRILAQCPDAARSFTRPAVGDLRNILAAQMAVCRYSGKNLIGDRLLGVRNQPLVTERTTLLCASEVGFDYCKGKGPVRISSSF